MHRASASGAILSIGTAAVFFSIIRSSSHSISFASSRKVLRAYEDVLTRLKQWVDTTGSDGDQFDKLREDLDAQLCQAAARYHAVASGIPCWHPSLNGATAAVLLNYFRQRQTFTLTMAGQPSRTYTSITQARSDGNNARLWSGMHYPSTVDIGDAVGEAFAKYVILTPCSGSTTERR